jgi:hypothetical protein
MARAGSNPFIGIHTLCLVQGDWTRRDVFFWGNSREVHCTLEFHIGDVEFESCG